MKKANPRSEALNPVRRSSRVADQPQPNYKEVGCPFGRFRPEIRPEQEVDERRRKGKGLPGAKRELRMLLSDNLIRPEAEFLEGTRLLEMNRRLKGFQGNEQGLNEELEKLRQEDMLMKNREDELNAVIGNLKEHNASLESNLKKAESEKLVRQKLISDLKDRLADAERKLTEGENLRRKLVNELLELKGNIRVLCRVRPPLPEAGSGLD